MIHIPRVAGCLLIVALLVPQPAQADPKPAPDGAWVEPMKKVHADFRGQKGTFATFGDSITVSLAFWAPLRNKRDHMSPEGEAAFQRVNHYMKPECWDKWRGPTFGNEGGMTIVWADKNVQQWLKQHQPETVLLMFGTNDLTSVPLENYERLLRRVVATCKNHGSIVILSTLPPRHGMLERSRQLAAIVRQVARDMKVPLCDYQAECLRRRPDDWDGAAAKFKDYKDYEVTTLIARDGVHPSFPKRYQGDYSEEGLRSNGYGLRSYVTMMTYAEVIRRVLEPLKPSGN
jgi:lysophospholipase L1-like esterase